MSPRSVDDLQKAQRNPRARGAESKSVRESYTLGFADPEVAAGETGSSTIAIVAANVRTFCLAILEQGELEAKLRPPLDPAGKALPDTAPGPAVSIDRPARSAGLVMQSGATRLPRPGELKQAAARITCLARFAHHELMAVELFAWALLRWPEQPVGLRCALLATLADEQTHCRLYSERLEAHGSCLSEHAHSDYFWRQVPAIAASPHGPRAFLAAMGLTLEQANLDFTLLYRDAFRDAGDEASARVCQRVYDDEVGHVRTASHWLMALSTAHGDDQVSAYEEAVPFPLAANRAKGRRFDVAGRRRAGLSDALIDHVRAARSSQELVGDPESR